MSLKAVFKSKQNTYTEDNNEQKTHADRKLALGVKINIHKETKFSENCG